MTELKPCAACTELVIRGTCTCPHCGGRACSTIRLGTAAALLGLTLVAACGGKNNQPDYGVPTTTDTATPPTSESDAGSGTRD